MKHIHLLHLQPVELQSVMKSCCVSHYDMMHVFNMYACDRTNHMQKLQTTAMLSELIRFAYLSNSASATPSSYSHALMQTQYKCKDVL